MSQPQPPSPCVTRRRVLVSTAAAAAAPCLFTASYAKAKSANGKLGVSSIGTSIYTNRYTGEGQPVVFLVN